MGSFAQTKRAWVQETSEQRLQELAERIRPITQRGGVLRFVSFKNPLLRGCYGKNPELYWHRTLTHVDVGEEVKGLVSIGEIKTYHSFFLKSTFSPTTAEVLAQIPKDYVDMVVAFQILGSWGNGVLQDEEALKDNYYTALTRLFANATN